MASDARSPSTASALEALGAEVDVLRRGDLGVRRDDVAREAGEVDALVRASAAA